MLKRVAIMLVAAGIATPVPTLADPPSWASAVGSHERNSDNDARVAFAMPQQRMAAKAVPAVRTGLPYGIGEGTCDRGKVARELVGANGAMVGVLAGGAIGRSMDGADQTCMAQTLAHAPDQQQVRWSNEAAGYSVMPVRSYRESGRYCREYNTIAMIGNHRQEVYGTACRQPDGSWQGVE